ncbi:MAG: hypothetical protein Q7R49_05520 [Candidatus Daviesbacteria bacterium]|nr:hypothetical protein [Candidatus Daviesbacteria bacterium]
MSEKLTLFNEYGQLSEAVKRSPSDQELEMARRLGRGESKRAIALNMGVSTRSVTKGCEQVVLNIIYRVATGTRRVVTSNPTSCN